MFRSGQIDQAKHTERDKVVYAMMQVNDVIWRNTAKDQEAFHKEYKTHILAHSCMCTYKHAYALNIGIPKMHQVSNKPEGK